VYKLFLADDEIIILRGLRKLLDWAALNIEIDGESDNGGEAEEWIVQHKPDLAILDIRMPVRTGLDILHTINKKGIDTKVIFLSGHEEFVYVQDALIYGAQNYLLKPVKKEKLLQAVQSALSQIDKNITVKNAMEKISKLEQNAALFNQLNEDYPCFTALAAYVHDLDFMNHETEKLILFSVFGLLEQKVINEKKGVVFSKDNLIYIILNHNGEDAYPDRTAERLIEYVSTRIGKKLLVGIGETVRNISAVSRSMYSAREALNYRFVRNQDRIFHFEPSPEYIVKIHNSEQIEQIMTYINVHYAENITLERVAKIAYMNPSYFSVYFKKNTGIYFKNFLTKIRMEHAVSLLSNEDIKTYELAERVGFTDPRYFSELFKKTYGKTPIEFKRDKLSNKKSIQED
jgi:two-component system response regulator YesN